jgi:hypothetical protein
MTSRDQRERLNVKPPVRRDRQGVRDDTDSRPACVGPAFLPASRLSSRLVFPTNRDQREWLHLKKPPVSRDRLAPARSQLTRQRARGVRENVASETARRMNHNLT